VEADTEKITIRRQGVGQIAVDYKRAMDGDPTADLVLQPQDVIYVPQIETAFFTVMGGVNRPGQYPLKGKLTLSEAIGVAGGPAPELGDLRKVRIVRAANQDNEKSETLDINLTELNEKGLPEPLIKRGDVITVAVRKQKTGFLDVLRTILPFGWIFR